jgi:NTE family protein
MGSAVERSLMIRHEEESPTNQMDEVAPGLLEKLASLRMLDSLDPRALRATAAEFDWFSLPGGQVLFRRGDLDDSLYIVLSGRLGAFLPNDQGKEVLVRQMTAGQTVGEMALLSGEPRSATVLALRDTELARLSKSDFTTLVEEHPRSLHFITDLLVRRLREPPRLSPSMEAPNTIALVPLDPELAAGEFARKLCEAFAELDIKAIVLDRSSSARPIDWFNALEDDHDLVIFQADLDASAWTRLCLRQADRVVLLVSARRSSRDFPESVNLVLDNPQRAPVELVLYRGTSETPSEILSSIRRLNATLHHHVRVNESRDFRRFARMISGRAIGLVLSGGGARGMSHVGVIRALREAGLELDLFGGASMGSIVAAGAALGWNDDELKHHMREAFFDDNPISDYTLPFIALARGRKTTSFLKRYFGNKQIEESLYPYFCVSTNLTTGELNVHRSGALWRATRASVAIPGVLPPVIDGSDILIDGGVLNNLPIDVMSAMRRGPIIASDVSGNYAIKASIDDIDHRPLWQLAGTARKGTPSIVTLLMAAGTISSYKQVQRLRDHVELLVEPALPDVNLLDWKSFDRIVEAGYRRTIESLEKHGSSLLSR